MSVMTMGGGANNAIGQLGARKAAIVLIQLGKERAAQVMEHLTDGEVETISAEIARLDRISSTETDSVLTEFRDLMVAHAHIAQGGFAFAQSVLEQSLGPERAREIMERLHAQPSRCRSSSCIGPTRPSCAASSPTSTRR